MCKNITPKNWKEPLYKRTFWNISFIMVLLLLLEWRLYLNTFSTALSWRVLRCTATYCPLGSSNQEQQLAHECCLSSIYWCSIDKYCQYTVKPSFPGLMGHKTLMWHVGNASITLVCVVKVMPTDWCQYENTVCSICAPQRKTEDHCQDQERFTFMRVSIDIFR